MVARGLIAAPHRPHEYGRPGTFQLRKAAVSLNVLSDFAFRLEFPVLTLTADRVAGAAATLRPVKALPHPARTGLALRVEPVAQ